MRRVLATSTALVAVCMTSYADGHEPGEVEPLACNVSAGEACYYALIDDFHANPSTTDSMGEIFLTLNSARTELRYLIVLDDLLGLKSNAEDRTEPDDVVGMHFHIHVPDTIGPHILNIFGLSTPTTDFGQEDADLIVDYENHTLRGIYDNSDATIDPDTGEPYPSFFSATSKPLDDTIQYLDSGEFVVAVHTNESGFQNLALHGHITRVVPEPTARLMLALAGCLAFAARGQNCRRAFEQLLDILGRRVAGRKGFGMNKCVDYCWALVAAVGVFAVNVSPLRADPAVDGEWTTEFTWGEAGGVEAVHTFLLPTGKVMFWSTWRESVGLWDPATADFSTVASFPAFNPFCSGHAWLPDGRLLVAGGHISNYNGENRADIYDPFTNMWASADPDVPDAPNMGSTSSNTGTSGKRWYPSATTLGNGDVLVTSGDVTLQGVTNRTVQIYEHATNSWRTLTGALRPTNDLLPEYPRVFLAPDGRAVSMSDNSSDTEFLDISGDGSWSYLQDTLHPGLHNYGPAVMYDMGKIAYVGGGGNPTDDVMMLDLTAASPSWRYAGGGTTQPPSGSPYAMAQPRRQNNATILADGRVLITGGTYIADWNDPNGLVATAEIWDPVTEQVTQVAEANVTIYRGYHSTALLLPDGRVLVTGGDHDYGGPIPGQNPNAEIYSPDYLFNEDGSPADRPDVTAAPDTAPLGASIFVETPDAASIAKALWIVPGAVTHAQNWTQRANVLDFTEVDGGLSIELPANGNEAPPGYYMLFLVNDQGVPSVAEWIRADLVPELPGDYNQNGTVDAADYTTWRDHLGSGVSLANDNTAGVDVDDYERWKNNFGQSLGSGTAAGSLTSIAVPEPATVASLIVVLAAAAAGCRGRRREPCRCTASRSVA